jgi:hypothetical protein
MGALAGQLDGLLNYTFSGTDFGSLAVQSAQSSNQNFTFTLQSLTATATGTPFQESSETFKVVAVTDSTSALSVSVTDSFGTFITTLTLYAIAFNSNALLVSTLAPSFIAEAAAGSDLSSLNGVVAAISTSPLAAGTSITFTASGEFACFALGTRLRSARGDVAVEDIREGDVVEGQLSGVSRRVVWVGRRSLDVARHPRPRDVAPVRVRADAFAPGRPRRDLLLSPDHAVQVDGALIPVRYLLNGATIAQEFPEAVTYFHVELDAHDVLLAEDLPCESYLDTGNRGAFANAGGPVWFAPDFARAVWAEQGCLPLLVGGPDVFAAKRRLLARARPLGWRRTDAPALRVLADGRPVRAVRHGGDWRISLPPGATELRFCSRAAVPAELSAEASDTRRLGVAIAHLGLDDAEPAAASFGAGWHAPEPGCRWTDGDAHLRVAGARLVNFTVAMTQTYWRDPPAPRLPAVRAA